MAGPNDKPSTMKPIASRCPSQFLHSNRVRAFIALAAWSAATGAWADTEDNLERKFTVAPGGTLIVEAEFGAVDISTHAGNEAEIRVWRRVKRSDKGEEEAFLQDRPVSVSQDGDTVTVRSVAPRKEGPRSRGVQTTQGKYTIVVPARFNVRLKTAGGTLAVRDLEGETKASSGGGDLAFSNLKGPVDGQTAGGRIKANGCEGTLKVKTGGGGIQVDGGRGSLEGLTAGGQVTVKSFDGPVSVKTGGGNIELDGIAGTINGATAGGTISASVTAVANDIKLTSGGGAVTLRAPGNAAFDFEASTTAGTVTIDLPVTVDVERKPSRQHVKGAVNGGGKSVVLRTTAGSVQVKRL